MIGLYMTETVTILRADTAQDRYGNNVDDAVTETDVPGCLVISPSGQVAPTDEISSNRDTVTTTRTLFAPAGTDLRPTDRVRHNGRVYQVQGEPSVYPGVLAHMEATLRVVTG